MKLVHSGDLGDIIYALPTLKALGGCDLVLSPVGAKVRAVMTQSQFENIEPLLRQQKYIKSVTYAETGDYDQRLNEFRKHLSGTKLLAAAHLDCFDLPFSVLHKPWLTVPSINSTPVVFNRSLRYHHCDALWINLRARFPDAVFIGHENEYADFVKRFGLIERVKCRDLLEAATMIASSKLFCGNQSCLAAIAEGLKVDMILEVDPRVPNCSFQRFGRINALTAEILV